MGRVRKWFKFKVELERAKVFVFRASFPANRHGVTVQDRVFSIQTSDEERAMVYAKHHATGANSIVLLHTIDNNVIDTQYGPTT